jgi:hypothetical protein
VWGWVGPQHAPPAIAARLGAILDDPVKAKSLGDVGRKSCEEKFAVERTVEQLRTILAQHETGASKQKGWLEKIFQGNA